MLVLVIVIEASTKEPGTNTSTSTITSASTEGGLDTVGGFRYYFGMNALGAVWGLASRP